VEVPVPVYDTDGPGDRRPRYDPSRYGCTLPKGVGASLPSPRLILFPGPEQRQSSFVGVESCSLPAAMAWSCPCRLQFLRRLLLYAQRSLKRQQELRERVEAEQRSATEGRLASKFQLDAGEGPPQPAVVPAAFMPAPTAGTERCAGVCTRGGGGFRCSSCCPLLPLSSPSHAPIPSLAGKSRLRHEHTLQWPR
jgi:hypothetical protein